MFSDVFSEFHLHQSSPHKFIGFSSSAGAIPPMAEMQAMWWCRLLEDKVKDSLGTAWSHLSLAKNWVLGCFGMFRDVLGPQNLLLLSIIFGYPTVSFIFRRHVILRQEGHPLDSSCYRLTDSRLCYGQEPRTLAPLLGRSCWILLHQKSLTSYTTCTDLHICTDKNYANLRCGLWPQTQFQVDSFPAVVTGS